jgi:hypothetical protein
VNPDLIITGELDYRVPVDQGIQMFDLRRNGVPAESRLPRRGHWVLKPSTRRGGTRFRVAEEVAVMIWDFSIPPVWLW